MNIHHSFRFGCLLCLFLLIFCVAATAEIQITLQPDNYSWQADEDIIFNGIIKSPDVDLSGAVLVLGGETDPVLEDEQQLEFISVNGISLDYRRIEPELVLTQEEAQPTITFEGAWAWPDYETVKCFTVTLSVVSSDQQLLAQDYFTIKSPELLAAEAEVTETESRERTAFLLKLGGLFLIIGLIVFLWLRLHHQNTSAEVSLVETGKRKHPLDGIIVFLFFLGVVLTPIHIQAPILYLIDHRIRFISYLNIPCTLAVLLSLFRLREWTKIDLCFFAVWLLLFIPMSVSNRDLEPSLKILACFQNLVPVFIVFYRMNVFSRRRCLKSFIILFDLFVVFLLCFAIEERLSGKAILKAMLDWNEAHETLIHEFSLYYSDSRFGSFWGHPLTNALFFNSFYVLNTVYFRTFQKKTSILVFFPVTLAGVLLSASKTGITVCFLLLIITCWKQKKWFLLSIPVLFVLYWLGAFDTIIYRFTHSSLTTGRIEGLARYFASGIYPLQWFSGYGSNAVLNTSHPLFSCRAGFEFPIMMYAFDYGILFSFFSMVGIYGYVTWRMLRKRQWEKWLCYTLIFAEINTYNGYALRNQDIFIFINFFTMILLNILPDRQEQIPDRLRTAGRAENA